MRKWQERAQTDTIDPLLRRRSSLLALRYSYSIGSSALSRIDVGTSRRDRHIEHGLVFHRQLHRQIGRLLALKDAVDVGGGAASMAYLVRPI